MIAEASPSLERVMTENSDTMLIYFSSGTTGMPKMIVHDFTYPWAISPRRNTGSTLRTTPAIHLFRFRMG